MKISPSLKVTLACLCWSVSALSRKFVLIGLSPLFLNFINSIFVALIVFIFSKHRNNLKVFRENYKFFLINALSGVTFGMSLAYLALEFIDLSLYGLLIKLQLVFVILIAKFFLNEKIKKETIPYILIAFVSAITLSAKEITSFNNTELIGVVASVLTAFCLSISTTSGKYLISKGIDPNQTTMIRFALGALLLTPVLPFFNLIDYSALSFNVVFWLAIGVITNTLGFTLYYRGLKNLEVITTSLIELIMPIFTTLLGILFLSETLSIQEVIASLVLLSCIYKLILLRITRKTLLLSN